MTVTYALTASLLFLGLTLMLFDVNSKLKNSDHRRISLILIGTSLFYVAMDCLWIVVYTAVDFHRGLFILLNFLFYLVYITLPYIWFLFAKHFAGSRITERKWNVLFAIPWFFNLALVILTMFGAGLLWEIGDASARYTRGPLFSIFSNVNIIYYFIAVIGIIVLLINGRGADRRTLLTVLGFSLIPALGVFIYTYWISVDAIYPFQPCCFFLGVMFAYILLLGEIHKKAEAENLRLAEEAKAAGRLADLMGSVGALLTNMPAMTFSKDVQTGKYMACNQSFAEYAHKKSPDEVVGLTDHEIFDPVTAEHFVEDDRKATAMEKPYVFFEDVPDAVGVPRNLQTTRLTFTDGSGRLCLLGMCVDVTDMTRTKQAEAEGRIRRQELEEKLALQEKLLQRDRQREQQDRMISALSADYWSVYYLELEKDEGVCYRSHADLDGTGFKAGERFPYLAAVTRYANQYIMEQYREEFLRFIRPESIREGLRKSHVISYTYMVSRHGTASYETVRFAAVENTEHAEGNRVDHVSACFSDTDAEIRRTIEQNETLAEALAAAEEANRAKTTFLSNMSHEIRTPMNAIIGLDKIALHDPGLSDQTREYLEKIGTSAHHLLGIINDILDMSRIESGQMAIKNEAFSFMNMLAQINTIISGQCHEKGITYDSRIIGSVQEAYVGDDLKLRQVMINILGNAVKFTPQGGTVTFTSEETAHYNGKSTLRFVVSDTGIGMSQEYLPKIFDAFSQEDSSTTSKYGSTGLGLPITRSIVERMNGNIEVQSEKGKGSTFTVTITLENVAPEQQESVQPASGRSEDILKGRRILLAEDIEVNAEIMMMVLSMREMEVEHALNGRIATEMFAEHKAGYYDAVLMDMRMPEMDGLEATRTIRAMDRGDAKTIPIIALTANAFDEDVQRSMQAGLNAHLSKPVEPEVLFETLEKLIRR